MKINKLTAFCNDLVFKFVFGKEAPRLNELESLSTSELYARTFEINVEAAKKFGATYFGFFMACQSLLALGAYEYVLNTMLGIIFALVLMGFKVGYTIICERKHDQLMQLQQL